MEFSRAKQRVELDPAGGDAHTVGNGTQCDLPQFRRFEALAGRAQFYSVADGAVAPDA